MTGQRGYTLVELIVGSAVMLIVCGGIMGLLRAGLAAAPALEESSDLHQRVRVAADALAADLAAAAAGTRDGPLSSLFAAVVPRAGSAGPGAAVPDVLTIRYAAQHGAAGRLLESLPPGGGAVVLDLSASCPRNTVACGFVSGTTAALLDDAGGQTDLVSIDAVGPGVLTVSDVDLPRVASYPAGARIAEIVEVTYALDAAARELRRRAGGGTFVLADNVTGLAFEYADAALHPLPLAVFADGPFRGAGRMAYDLDLLRIRSVGARLTFRAASGAALVADVSATVAVSLRNGK